MLQFIKTQSPPKLVACGSQSALIQVESRAVVLDRPFASFGRNGTQEKALPNFSLLEFIAIEEIGGQ